MNPFTNTVVGALRGHRLLLACVLGSLGCAVLSLGGLLLDDRILTGAPIWLKPFKFSVSIAIYALTLAWLISYVERGRRIVRALASAFSVMMLGELLAITIQVIRGTTSHFNFQTPLDSGIWMAMGVMIVVAWLCNLAIAVVLLRQRIADRPMASALRLGLLVALVGMAVAFLMTTPSLGVVAISDDNIIGAHSVSVRDDGPGLPIVGWSTEGGDLRVPHFLGIHALQALPLVVLALGALSTRYARLRNDEVRLRIVRLIGVGYLGVVILTTWQAARGQSIINPDATTLLATGILLGALIIGAALIVRSGTPENVAERVPATKG